MAVKYQTHCFYRGWAMECYLTPNISKIMRGEQPPCKTQAYILAQMLSFTFEIKYWAKRSKRNIQLRSATSSLAGAGGEVAHYGGDCVHHQIMHWGYIWTYVYQIKRLQERNTAALFKMWYERLVKSWFLIQRKSMIYMKMIRAMRQMQWHHLEKGLMQPCL